MADLSNKKKTERELRLSEALNRTILQTTADGYWIVDPTGRMADVNEAYLRMSGYRREEFIGLPIQSIDADEAPVETAARMERIFQNGSERFEVRHRRKDGSVFDVEVSATYLPGEQPLIICFCRDITERNRSMQELLRIKQVAEESEARFKALHNASFGGIAIHDKGVILDANQGLADLTGYSSIELIGMDGLGLIAPEDRQLVMDHILAGYEKPYEAVGLRKNGEKYPVRLEGRRIPYQGKLVRVVEFRDISDQKEAERLIGEAQERLQIIFDGLNALIYIADIATHELLFINEYGKKLCGEGEVANKCWQFLQHLDGPCSFCTNDKIVNADGTPSGIYRWECKNLVTGRWYDLTDQALRWVDGRLVRMEIAIDITERKQAEEALRSSQTRYQALLEQSSEAQALVDIQTQEIAEINRRVTELFGYSLPADAPLYLKQVAMEPPESTNSRYAMLKEQRSLPPATMTFRHKNGTAVQVERAGTVITLDGRDYLLISMRDMTVERRREAELARDVRLAGRVQRELLPELPASPRVALRSLYYPWHAVSGDSYQMEWRNDGILLRGFLIDVSGHGLATALQSASISVLLREAAGASTSLLEEVRRVNAQAAKYFAEGSYATLLGFELDLTLQELRYVGAGISKFFINGREILTPGMFVGVWEDAEFESGVISVAAGDCFHFLTDGFTDALAQPENANFWSPNGKDFEADVAALKRLAKSGTLRDDATGVCLKIESAEISSATPGNRSALR